MADKVIALLAQERRDLAGIAIAVCAGFALAFGALYLSIQLAGYPGGSRSLAGTRDFVSYWAAGHQLVLHGSPYDRDAIAAMEHREGLQTTTILIMRNPPWALPFAYPLGFLGLRVAAVVWSVLLLACLLISVRLVRQFYGNPPNHLHWSALSFTPALLCFLMGQTALFALLGLALFLRWHRTRPFLAGVSLWLCALKPQLFLPLASALAVWIIVTRAWKALAGGVLSIALSSALALLLYPHAWQDYIRLMRSPAVENDFIPCLAYTFREWINPRANWLQYLPSALTCLWAVIYYWQRRAKWDWKSNGALLMLVSFLTSPYCWIYDQCLAIPAVLDGVYTTRSRSLIVVLAIAIFTMDMEICVIRITSLLFLWTAPVWLAWYLMARSVVDPAKISGT